MTVTNAVLGENTRKTETSAVVIGWVAGGGAQRNVVGSLILGAYDDEGVSRHIGHVGTGFTASVRRQLREQLEKLKRPTSSFPPRQHILTPIVVCLGSSHTWSSTSSSASSARVAA